MPPARSARRADLLTAEDEALSLAIRFACVSRWWAHLVAAPQVHPINIQLTILPKKIEELGVFRASSLRASRLVSSRREKSWTGERAARALGQIDTPNRIYKYV